MVGRLRPYVYYDFTISTCPECLRRVDAKIVFEDDRVIMRKRCPQHGAFKVLLADDVEYYRRSREQFVKQSEMPERFNTPVEYGCPYDCGLCSDHEQHSCISVIELGDACNLECPVCYADSGPSRTLMRPLAQVEAMLDAVVRNEGEPDVVQLSGGEPTIHPEFFEILAAAKARPIRHLMVNSNGVRMAKEPEFVARLAEHKAGFEIYLQFDSLVPETLRRLRGTNTEGVHQRALDHLERHGISTTLVVTLMRGANDEEIGALIDFALKYRCVRGITFQPVQEAGRLVGFDHARDRLTLSEVRRRIVDQSSVFSAADILPVPCHPDALAMAYAIKTDEGVTALSGAIGDEVFVSGARSTILLEQDGAVRARLFDLLSAGNAPDQQAVQLRDLLCCIPRVEAPMSLGYENVFRVLIVEFMDAWNLDVRSVKRSCVHIVHPDDGRLIPFDTYNLLYRGTLEQRRLAPLQRERSGRLGLPVLGG